jgi:hypothetical protein
VSAGNRFRGARHPEELDTLLEDAFVLRDAAATARLFEAAGVLVADGLPTAHGRAEIGGVCTRLWHDGRGYVADARRVVTARDVALLVGAGAVHVVRRGRDGSVAVRDQRVHRRGACRSAGHEPVRRAARGGSLSRAVPRY